MLFAGATGSGYYLQYGERKMLGFSGFIDADTRRGMDLKRRELDDLSPDSQCPQCDLYDRSALPHDLRPIPTLCKALVGVGKFNFPYNYAHGSYLVFAPGAEVDMRLSRRIRLRWPTWSISTGLSLPTEP